MSEVELLYPHICGNPDCFKLCRRVPGLAICGDCEKLMTIERRTEVVKSNPVYLLWLIKSKLPKNLNTNDWLDWFWTLNKDKDLHRDGVSQLALIISYGRSRHTFTSGDLRRDSGFFAITKFMSGVVPKAFELGVLKRINSNTFEFIPNDQRSPEALKDEELHQLFIRGVKSLHPQTIANLRGERDEVA